MLVIHIYVRMVNSFTVWFMNESFVALDAALRNASTRDQTTYDVLVIPGYALLYYIMRHNYSILYFLQ